MDQPDQIERTLLQLPQVHVFKIPVRKTADGHRASDWPKDPTWTGKVKIVSVGRIAAIILQDDKNQTFAVCQVTDDNAVERTLDSGRYFVLRITNAQGRHAFIGIAFNERNDAFDFNVALAEFKNELEREDQAVKMADLAVGPMKDLSLKDGEKIKIKIAAKKKTEEIQDDGSKQPHTVFTKSKNNGILPPPPMKSSAPMNKATVIPPAKVTSNEWDFDSDPFGSSATNKLSSSNSDFEQFDSFGSSDPFASVAVLPNASTQPPQKPPKNASKDVNLLDL